MDIFINDKPFKESIATNQGIDGILTKIFKDHIPQDEYIEKIIIDNETYDIGPELVEGLQGTHLDQIKCIKINTLKTSKLAKEAILSADEYVNACIKKLDACAKSFSCHRLEEANHYLQLAVEELDLILQLISKAEKILSIQTRCPSEDRIIPVIEKIIAARANSNYVEISDLIEYELIDTLQEWQKNHLKKLRLLAMENATPY